MEKVVKKDAETRKTCLDFPARQSDEWPCQTADQLTGESKQMGAIYLMGTREAGQILGINPNAVYMLWKKRLLGYWNIHDTKKTNLNAGSDFLGKMHNQELLLEDEKE